MKTIRTALLFVVATLSLAACHQDRQASTFSIEGTLENGAGKMLYIEEMTPDNGTLFRDSILCDRKGRFEYEGTMDYQTFFNLHANEYDYIVLLPDYGETVSITGDFTRLGESYMVNGSSGSRELWQIQSYINEANHIVADIVEQDKQNQATLDEAAYLDAKKATDSLFVNEHNVLYGMLMHFIDDNMGSLSTLYAIDAPFNHRNRVFYAGPDFELFEQVLQGLQEIQPDNPHTQFFQNRVERERSARMFGQQEQQQQQLQVELGSI